MTLQEFNQLSKNDVFEALEKCCVSKKWINGMVNRMPFETYDSLVIQAAEVWYNECSQDDFLEAFSGHPKIADIESLKRKFEQTKEWAGNEQAGVNDSNESVLQDLANYNQLYENKFGYIFIVSASGKSAEEMLRLIMIRIEHAAETELKIAMTEQHKITNIRLAKQLPELTNGSDQSSHVTTHVLDTSTGIPGKGMTIKMKHLMGSEWQLIALGITNNDGRIGNLLPPGIRLKPGRYLMEFDTDDYYNQHGQTGFYPEVGIQFKLRDDSHYHIPLLLNPYGFTTYRGS